LYQNEIDAAYTALEVEEGTVARPLSKYVRDVLNQVAKRPIEDSDVSSLSPIRTNLLNYGFGERSVVDLMLEVRLGLVSVPVFVVQTSLDRDLNYRCQWRFEHFK